MPHRRLAVVGALALALLGLCPAVSPRAARAQETARPAAARLPLLPDACRSEQDARLAFGLCPDSTFDFYAGGAYREDVPRPEAVLGYPIGSWHTTYGRMERFLESLAEAAPERVRVFDYGLSVERQVMHLVAVSSEENISRLDEIRSGLAALADPRATTEADAARLAGELPVVVWLNAANDGNESAAFEAAMQIAYQLAAGEDERTRGLRAGALTLINLAHNPESHERHVAWYNAFVAGDPDPAALEHRAPWGMSTNNNHYQFDLNRDALGLTQTETRAVAAELRRWRPQVFVDLHGQTTQMFFPPAADPVSPAYPEQMTKWLERFGQGNAAAFDAHGWSYYVRDVFDLFYPGYWDTYPGLHGATGMTYETDGGGSKGVRWRRDDGTILTFADGIAHHFVASLATVETAVANREERLLDYWRFFAAGLAKPRETGVRGVVLLAGEGAGEGSTPAGREAADRLATTLLRHGIEVSRTTSDARVTGTPLAGGDRETRTVPGGSYVVDLAQPNGILAYTLLAPEVELPASFIRQELAKLARSLRQAPGEGEGDAFYDVTAWSLPLALGVPALWTGEPPSASSEPLRLPEGADKAPGGWESEMVWPPAGGAAGRARSAYVWAPGGRGPWRLAARLMGEGFHVAVSQRPLVADGRDFPRGSFIARVGRNPEALHARVDAVSRDAGVAVHPAASAFPERGPTGTGSESTRTLRQPAIAVAAGEGVGVTSYGALWFELERRIGQPFTALRLDGVVGTALDRFDVLVLPDGFGYGRALGERGAEHIRAWVERGGTLVAYGGGARWAQDAELGSFLAPDTVTPEPDSVAAILERVDDVAQAAADLPPRTSPGARPGDPLAVPGSFLRARLDPGHWLTFGYEGASLPVLARSLPLRPSREGVNPVVYAAGDALAIAGFAWPDNTLRTYGGASFATVDRLGEGLVVLFAEDPLFRGVFDAPAGLLLNALYLGARGRPGAEGG